MENFNSDIMGLKYCEECNEDNYRIEMGYSPKYGDCNHWQCKILDLFNFLAIFIVAIIFIIPVTIILIGGLILSFSRSGRYAVQEQGNEKNIHVRLERKKPRKSSMDEHSMERSKSRQKK